MKRTLPLILIILLPFVAFSKGFIVKGSVEGVQTGTVSLDYLDEGGEDTTITTVITTGEFTLAGTVVEPELARLTISGSWNYSNSFFLENTNINIKLVKDAPEKNSITGSANELVYEQLQPGLMNFFTWVHGNKQVHEEAAITHNHGAVVKADSVWTVQQRQWIQSIRNTITANKENYAALHFIKWLLFKPDNYDTIYSVYMQLSPTVRKGLAAKKFIAEFEHLHNIAPGQPAPEISGTNPTGQTVKLAGAKGKVVLLDFWSSYCGPCRQENKRMLPVYDKYHPEGFEIVSFSLDNDRNMWLQAMQQDAMPWPQISELRGGASATANLYDITDLPRNVLIDRGGKIYAKDLHGEELAEAIKILLARGK